MDSLHISNNDSSLSNVASAFDSRNVPENIWDCFLPCGENDTKTGPPQDSTVLSDSTVLHETNSYVAKTLYSLPIKERDDALNDIHGVADLEEEGKDFIDEYLHLLDSELDKIKSKRAYLIAKSISENYVCNSKFRLTFLRADNYNAKNAATRIVRHFEFKLELFGKEKLTQDITLHDLTEEDLCYMKTGFFQLFPEKDRSGRSVLFSQSTVASCVPIETRRRVTWYLHTIVSEDEETQRKGAVVIFYGIGLRGYNFETNYKVHHLFKAFPVRLAALHLCFHNHVPHALLYLVKTILRNNDLGRVRIHYSSRLECVYTLMTFGIPRTLFGPDGQINISFLPDWINQRMAVEDARRKSSCCLLGPNKFDILMGKGKKVVGNSGNIHYREVMETYKNEYEEGSRWHKANITRHIFKEIESNGGRFIKEGDFGWVQIDDEAAKKKIGHDFRNFRR